MTARFDVYYGGPRDGQRWDLDQQVAADRIVDGNGAIYVRHPDFDTETDRAWFNLPSDKPTSANGVHVEPQAGQKFITLADLRTLLTTAVRMGHADGAVVHGRVSFGGKVQLLGIKPAAPEDK
jgi:hypothetical protein